jgi:hypothetical protein
MTRWAAYVLALALALACPPAAAQFPDQGTWGGTSGGSANAQTITIGNWTSNKAGVPLRFIPGAANTGAATLNVSGVGAVALRKQTSAGIVALVGGELQTGQIYVVTFDGTFFQLQNASTGGLIAATSIFTAGTGNCGSTVSLGGSAFYTATIGAPGSFPTGCVITFQNADAARGKGIVVSGLSTVRLFPGVQVSYTNNGSSWIQSTTASGLSVDLQNHTLFVDSGGSDSPTVSDCLTLGAGSCATFQQAVNIAQANNYQLTPGVTIQYGCNVPFTTATSIVRGLGGIINFMGNSSTPLACQLIATSGVEILDIEDGQQFTITGFEIGYSSGGGTAVFARQIVIADINNCYFASNAGGTLVVATDLASVNLTNDIINSNANVFVNSSNGAQVQVNGISVPGGGTGTFTFWYVASNTATITGTPAYAISGTATGAKYSCAFNSVINLATAYPGALTAGTATNGCQANPP